MNQYILTGSTGVVGAAVLKQLRQSACRIYLPVRATSRNTLVRRMKQLVSLTDPGPGQDAARLIPVSADLAAPGLGMAEADHTALLMAATHIIHCAGDVRMNRPPEQIREETLAMTRNMTGLMEESSGIRKMEFVSTVGVAGFSNGPLTEDWTDSQRSFRNSYEAAKAAAESHVRKKRTQGLNITVHRPSMVVGDSRTGEILRFQVFYHLCELLSGRFTRGWVPDLSGIHLDIIPSDYVAELLVLSSRTERGLPKILHACSGEAGSIPMPRLLPIIRDLYSVRGITLPGMKSLPAGIYALLARGQKMVSSGPAARRLATLPHFLAYLKSPQWFENRRTLAALSGDGPALPDYRNYIDKAINYYLATRNI